MNSHIFSFTLYPIITVKCEIKLHQKMLLLAANAYKYTCAGQPFRNSCICDSAKVSKLLSKFNGQQLHVFRHCSVAFVQSVYFSLSAGQSVSQSVGWAGWSVTQQVGG